MESPRLLPFLVIHAEELVFILAEIGVTVGQRDRPGNVSAGLNLPHLLALRQCDHMQEPVTTAKGGLTVGHRGRAIDVIASFIDPVGPAGAGRYTMQLEIVAARQDPGLAARFHPIRPAEDLVPRLVFPDQLPAHGVEGIEKRVA